MLSSTKIINIVTGLTMLNIGFVSLTHFELEFNFKQVLHIEAFLCNMLMGMLIIASSNKASTVSLKPKPYWLGMLLMNIVLVKNIGTENFVFCVILITVGFFITIVSLMALGGSFSIAPVSSVVKKSFTYQLMRHPVYFGEMIMIMACVISNLSILTISCFMFLIFFLIKRIHAEEIILEQQIEYRIYQKSTKWKLVPFIW